jgi:phosphate transport system substrate-binding protein
MRIHRFARPAVIAAAAVTLVAAACGNTSSSSASASGGSNTGGFQGTALNGAGSTFAAPLYQLWSQSFLQKEPDAQINYQAIGSGGGIEQFTSQTVDFGASDVPLQSDEITNLPSSNYIQFPTALGAVVFAYNLQGVDSGLKLDGKTTADIFLGNITKWNDPAITSQNPGVNLPDEPIQVVHRSDESGTTSVWTSWLSAESPEWSSKVGADKAVQWPVGTGGNGNEGVAAGISQTEGAAGYLSYDFAVTAGLGIADIQAPDGSYVAPSIDSISKAGGGLKFPIQSDTNILNSSTKGAYPVASTTYVLVYTDQTDQAKAQTLVDFWTWALTDGQSQTEQINYSPLPSDFATSALKEVSKITVNGTPVSPTSSTG